jgi:cysteine desulfurase / selenocysteine lyase
MEVERIRKDFPLYSSEEKDVIYLDNACQTLRPTAVIRAMDEYYSLYPACGGRSVHRMATTVSIKMEEARESVGSFLGASPSESIVFTKNCTEAINLVAKGIDLRHGDVVVTSDAEHNSNHIPWMQVQKTKGIRRRFLSTPPSGEFDLEAFKSLVTKEVRMVSLAHTNNVTGVTIPAKAVVEIAHDKGAICMLDGAQAAPHQKVDVKQLDVDLYPVSLHKMLGPSGVGALYGKNEILKKIDPLITGGGAVSLTDLDHADFLPPPERFEGGLLNYAGIIGSKAALDYLGKIGMDQVAEQNRLLNTRATEGLSAIEKVEILAPADPVKRGSILPFNIKGMGSHDVAMILDEVAAVMIRSGMHCAHPYFQSRKVDGCARASFYFYNTTEEVDRFVKAVEKVASTFSM